ncbi:MAG TPA: aspartate-semialdehyde dehydrogenase [Anaerolineae bacterium]|nr:aspartate-semialdehyde dehydrogenase [Anaerolineae bacterium]HIP70338.1 aspartate-semialdehyde dehydrogenase [Anaerolineae bacterium]
MDKKIPVGILAATGTVGQRFVELLADHPWFEITVVTGSERTVGRPYGEGVNWKLLGDPPEKAANLIVQPTEPNLDVKILFSALPTPQAKELEPQFAQAGYAVLTNASPYRMDPYVPLLIPEVNPDHTGIIPVQQEKYGWEGYIVANANCSTTSIVLPMKILHEAYGVETAVVVTLQAISGAGYPGVPSMDILGNVIPHIGGEDAKLEREPRKLCGTLAAGEIQMADFVVSAQANRVPVFDGHLASISLKLRQSAGPEEVIELFQNWQPPEICRQLPSIPDPVLIYRPEPDRPQPRLDTDSGSGLAWTLGKVRSCPVNDVRFLALAHNTLRGAASGSILNAELLLQQGLLL